ncbi:HupE/UreJ family protein [Chelatococcus sambhunathii]|uniref:HupE/UreJ family protein n=1 Tax=Chelatococcus sambhunathii TaxID=363953 RepID=A0ABU1DKK5_9HYPH|nr:HupE/UreJ family protein [Chelatococcus sambhunathii]MDR4308652.1 HupE/UreJ family protein [Chelatococcus sambhunathii]
MSLRLLRPALGLAAALVPSVAFAHPGHADAVGFVSGFGHPVGGLDHVLAMVLVGVFAFQLGGRALWLVPAAFVAVMAAGGALGMAGVEVPFVEAGIAISIIALGAAVAFGVRAPAAVAMAMVGLFAIFHGHAHSAEAPETAAGAAYAAGFMLATALLHAAGVGFGFLIGKVSETRGPIVTRVAGAAAGLAGVAILVGAL